MARGIEVSKKLMVSVLIGLSLTACTPQGGSKSNQLVSVAWAVRGPAGKTITIETFPGTRRSVKFDKNGASGTLHVPAGQEAKLWADLPSGETLGCILTDRTGFTALDSGTGHCQVKLETRLTPDK